MGDIMNRPVISAIGHVAIAVTDMDAAVRNATTLMGLRISERRGEWTDLTHGASHHSLQYVAGATDALHHIGLVAADTAALEEIRGRAENAGFEIVADAPLDPALRDGYVIAGPEGFLYEVYTGMPEDEPPYSPTGVKPNRFGHVTISVADPGGMRDFLQDVLDFRLSDEVAGIIFLRCNVDHHGIGLVPGAPGLHHHAWEVQSTGELGQLGDRVDETGGSLLWGPSRHGAGNNVAAYYLEPCGVVVEYYCDMLRIYDDASYTPTDWNLEDHKWFSKWAPLMPEGFQELGIPLAQPALSR
jgi:catechol 2,3-dioxygenase-like lactoylglutathione lyase family enzyme